MPPRLWVQRNGVPVWMMCDTDPFSSGLAMAERERWGSTPMAAEMVIGVAPCKCLGTTTASLVHHLNKICPGKVPVGGQAKVATYRSTIKAGGQARVKVYSSTICLYKPLTVPTNYTV